MPKLGKLLADNIQREKQAATDSSAALELQRTEKDKKNFLTMQSFFENAKQYFIVGIISMKPTKMLFQQVGGGRYTSGVDCHEEASSVLEGYRAKDGDNGPASLYDPKRFSSLWHEFQQWASSEGLHANWKYCWDGGGMDSWWRLEIAPAPSAPH